MFLSYSNTVFSFLPVSQNQLTNKQREHSHMVFNVLLLTWGFSLCKKGDTKPRGNAPKIQAQQPIKLTLASDNAQKIKLQQF